jgi:GTPase SAR1 family protein
MVAVVYDVSSRESFQSAAKWLQGVRAIRPNNPIGGVLIANKIDLRETGRDVVSSEEGEQFAQQNGLMYFECSAVSSALCVCMPNVCHMLPSNICSVRRCREQTLMPHSTSWQMHFTGSTRKW